MVFTFRTLSFCLALALMLAFPQWSVAAPKLSTARTSQYVRLNFNWPEKTAMQVSPGGKTVTVHFSQPVGADVASIATQMKPYVVGITRSADGKTITLSLSQPYHVRHFVSGTLTGLDVLVTQQTPEKAAAPKPAPKTVPAQKKQPVKPAPAASAKKPEPKKKPEVKAEKTPAKAAEKPAPKPAANPMLSTKKQATVAPMLTTKAQAAAVAPQPAARAAPEKVAETAPAEKPAAPNPILTTKKPEPAPQPAAPTAPPAQAQATAPETSAATAAPVAPPPPPPAPAGPQGNLQIGIVPDEKGPILQFPWNARTALVAFTRGKNLWLVFDRSSTIDLARLRGIMPASVTQVDRFAMPDHTVLRLTSRKPQYAHVSSVKGTYQWQVQLRANPAKPLNSTDMSPITNSGVVEVLMKLFDVSEPVAFYDPDKGDRWLLLPVYEAGRGLENAHRYPGFTLLQTGQGIAIATEDDGLQLKRSRAGVKLTRDGGLTISSNLPYLPGQRSVAKLDSATNNIVLAYDKYSLAGRPLAEVRQNVMQRLVRSVDENARADLLRQLAGMYVAQGFGPEASTILTEIRNIYPDYYAKEHLAIMHAAAAFLADRLKEAAFYLNDPSLADNKEAQLWRDAVGLFVPIAPPKETTTDANGQETTAPAPAPTTPKFDYLAYEAPFLKFYPPKLRQKLSIIAADRYLQLGNPASAVTLFDKLNEDGILKPVQPYAEFMFGKVAADRNKPDDAIKIWQRLVDQDKDQYISARARFALITTKYATGNIDIDEAIKEIEAMRLQWRGDNFERELLSYLGQLYVDNKQYGDALRTWKELLVAFPNAPDALEISGRMAELFEKMFTQGLADDMKPLQSLAVFYEYRELTPVGARGDALIQKLADRLAAVDLLDQAIQLLEHQVQSRTEGLDRARVGARLAVLHLINGHPKKALDALESSNYGEMTDDLRTLRLQLTAQALDKLNKGGEALHTLEGDHTQQGEELKLEILWRMQDWPNVINQAEQMLALRKDLTAKLTPEEEDVLLRLALAYTFEQNYSQLTYLRDYYLNLINDKSEYKPIFSYLTNDTAPLDTDDVSMLTGQINHTESFLKTLRDQVSQGKLGQATGN